MRRILTILLTLLMLLPVCAAAEDLQFEPPTRSATEVAIFDIIAESIANILDNSVEDESIKRNFVVSATYDPSLDAFVCLVEMPYWSVGEVLQQTDDLYVILEALGYGNAFIVQKLQETYGPLDVYTIAYGDDGEVKYLNVNGRDLSDILRLTQD